MRKLTLFTALMGLAALPALADGDAADGEKVFKKCKACHDIGEDAKNKVGPILNGIVGRAAAQNPDFNYSDDMRAAGEAGLIWDEETLDKYLKKPKDVVPKTKMTFAGLRKEDEIEDVIAYLKTFE